MPLGWPSDGSAAAPDDGEQGPARSGPSALTVTGPLRHHLSMGEPPPSETLFVREVRRRIAPLLRGAGIDPALPGCWVTWHGPDVDLHFAGIDPSPSVRQAIGVNALSAVGALGRTVGNVTVSFDR